MLNQNVCKRCGKGFAYVVGVTSFGDYCDDCAEYRRKARKKASNKFERRSKKKKVSCSKCGGSGSIGNNNMSCIFCGGKGYKYETESAYECKNLEKCLDLSSYTLKDKAKRYLPGNYD